MNPFSIPQEELNDYYLVAFKDRDNKLLFNAVHISEFDWSQNDIRYVPMDIVFSNMKSPKRI